jgi:hypothetical protein
MWIILYVFASASIVAYHYHEKIAYNLIYLFSSIQILSAKIKNTFFLTNATKPLTTDDFYMFESINDHEISEFIDFKESFANNPNFLFSKSPDSKMIIFNDTTDNVTNKICYYKPYENVTSQYDISNVSFISFKVILESNEYNIKLSSPEYNFYIVGNEINRQWFKYYFNKYLNINLMDYVEYTIEIVDENVNFVYISYNDSIKFEKESYEIIKHEENKIL